MKKEQLYPEFLPLKSEARFSWLLLERAVMGLIFEVVSIVTILLYMISDYTESVGTLYSLQQTLPLAQNPHAKNPLPKPHLCKTCLCKHPSLQNALHLSPPYGLNF